jgi:hypothetical protein
MEGFFSAESCCRNGRRTNTNNVVVPQVYNCQTKNGACTHGAFGSTVEKSVAKIRDVKQECTGFSMYAWVKVCTDTETGEIDTRKGCGFCN